MKMFIGFANAFAKWPHTLNDEFGGNSVLRAFVSKPPKYFRSNGARYSTWCRVRPHVNVVAGTVFRVGSRVSFPSCGDIKFSAPFEAGIVECQPGCVGP